MKGVIMNFQDVRNAPIPQTGYAPLVDVIAIIQAIGAAKLNAKGKTIASVKIQDSTGETHTVTINDGQHGLPNNSMLNRKAAFALQQYNGRSGLAYSGFCNGLASGPIEQPQQPQRPLPAPNFPQREQIAPTYKAMAEVPANSDEAKRARGFSISYAKDLVVCGKIDRTEMYIEADRMKEYILEGIIETIEAKPLQATGKTFDEWEQQESKTDDQIPF